MKITKWNEKVSAILDTMLEKDDAVYCNRDDGVVFANKQGTFAMFCPEHTVWTVKPFPVGIEAQRKNALSAIWDKTIQSDSKLADSTEIGMKVKYAGEDYTIVDVDYNGGLLIDKPAQFTETTAIYEFDQLLHLSGQV